MQLTGTTDSFYAAKQLCDDFGIPYTITPLDPEYKQYIEVYKFVAGLYNAYLRTKTCPNPNYFIDRGFSEDVVKDYLLGYCPSYFIERASNTVMNLKQVLMHAFPEISETVLDTYGLYNSFGVSIMSERFTFTIKDVKGNPVGFSGRSLDPDNPAKYYNTGETPFFSKKNLLFNLDIAKRYGSVIVVEGFCDALTLVSQGVPNVVAAMGTAFGLTHLDLLKGKEIILSLDNDSAGLAQMCKIILDNRNQYFRVWLWDGAKDFNDLALTNLDHLRVLIDNKKIVSGPEFVINYNKRTQDLSTLEGREKLWLDLVKLVGSTSPTYTNLYPVNPIYTPVARDYYYTIITRIIKGRRG
jgi:DNA primase